jgi:2-methylisocitrate lyase-like PEP mutase family enzyme
MTNATRTGSALDTNRQRLDAAARRLLELHRPGDPLVLVNAWDAVSAKAIESAGATVIATSSAAIAQANGVPDDNTAADIAFAAVRTIVQQVSVPVTADLEGGYGLSAQELIDRLLFAGAVGCNIEDTDHATGNRLQSVSAHAAYLADIRAAATAAGVHVVINARIDTIIQHPNRDAAATLAETVRRARFYIDAGADCVYPIGLTDPTIVKQLAEVLAFPVNVNPSGPLTALAAAGAARISTGAGTYRFMMADLERRAHLMFTSQPDAFT